MSVGLCGVIAGAGADVEEARALAAHLGVPLAEAADVSRLALADPSLALRLDDAGLALVDGDLELRGDFARMLGRVRPGVVQRELLVRAAKVKPRARVGLRASKDSDVASGSGQVAHVSEEVDEGAASGGSASFRGGSSEAVLAQAAADASLPTAVDATAGLGEDALLLAAAGFSVRLYERNPVIAALLRDALRRAREIPQLADATSRMELVEADSVDALAQLEFTPDVVVLDPMFPARRKSASVKKKLQLIQRLEVPCESEDALLDAALAARPRKVVVKRPSKGPYLAGVKPSYSLEGKAVRYDVIALP